MPSSEKLTRPIIGIENRTAQEAFDIMCDRIRSALSRPALPGQEAFEALSAAQTPLEPEYAAALYSNRSELYLKSALEVPDTGGLVHPLRGPDWGGVGYKGDTAKTSPVSDTGGQKGEQSTWFVNGRLVDRHGVPVERTDLGNLMHEEAERFGHDVKVPDTEGLMEELQYAACALACDGETKQHVCWRAAAELSRLRVLAKHWEREALCLGEFAASYNRDEELQTLMKSNSELCDNYNSQLVRISKMQDALAAATEDNKRLREALETARAVNLTKEN